MKKAWVLSYPLSAQQCLWSDWVDAQDDLSLRWAHSHFVGFVMSWLISPFTTVVLFIVYQSFITTKSSHIADIYFSQAEPLYLSNTAKAWIKGSFMRTEQLLCVYEPHQNLVRLLQRKTSLSSSVNCYWPFQGGASAVVHFTYSYPTSFGKVPVLVIFVLKCLLLKTFNLLLHLKKCLSILE